MEGGGEDKGKERGRGVRTIRKRKGEREAG